MEKALVSIVVPVYNSEKFILDTINTVEKQSYKNWELIFVDDCSKDNSTKIIKERIKNNNKIKLIELKKNSGAATARNVGIDESKGSYIAFLDSDDLWKKEKLENQLAFIKENGCAFSFTGYEFADEYGLGNGKVVKVPFKMNYKKALKNTTIFTSTVMFDLEKISKDQIKFENIKSEDTATWWKVLKSGYVAYGLNENLTYYRRTSGTLSSNKFEAIKRTWNLYRTQEKLNIFYSFYNFCFYAFNAVRRRI